MRKIIKSHIFQHSVQRWFNFKGLEGNVLQPFEEGNFRKNELSSMNQDSSSRTRSSSLVEESKPIRARHMTGKQAQDQRYFTALRPCNISTFFVFTESEVFKNLEFEIIYFIWKIYTLLVCLFVCLIVSNKRQNGWTDWTQILCGTSHNPREGFLFVIVLYYT